MLSVPALASFCLSTGCPLSPSAASLRLRRTTKKTPKTPASTSITNKSATSAKGIHNHLPLEERALLLFTPP